MLTQSFENMIIPITDFKNHIGKYLQELTSPKILLKNNKPSAVIVPYEQFRTMEKIVEYQMDLELVKEMDARLADPNSKYLSTDELLSELEV